MIALQKRDYSVHTDNDLIGEKPCHSDETSMYSAIQRNASIDFVILRDPNAKS